MLAGRVSQLAMGSVELVEKNDEEEEKRQAKLRRAQDQLNKRLEEHVYSAAAAVQESIAALMSAEPRSQRHRGRSKADWSAGTVPGHGLPATCPIVASATSASDAIAKRVGGGGAGAASGRASSRPGAAQEVPRRYSRTHGCRAMLVSRRGVG